MNDKLKRCMAAGLMVIMLLVGFLAEYTHRHAMPSASQPTVADTGSQPSGKSTAAQFSHNCFICQLSGVAAEIAPAFSLAILSAPQAWMDFAETSLLLSCSSHIFLRRGPPAFLA
ncbi:MAG: hypothetical protein ONB46_02860 [candidate division KSB1 bacterium]|nr:hypothetical protein [candidate division KSB1 bacterium]MDZ7364823.1 hypothetical protein [candidate division KSB1 bacterium]MDZ7402926.1 hypothetical protein [candidate division KSB1 bacterium]